MDVQVVEPLLAEWHSCYGSRPVRASDLIPLPSANAIAPAGSRLHHRSILLGRLLAEMAGQTVGPWTVDRSEGPPSGATTATWYAIRQVGPVSGPAIVPELIAPVAAAQEPEPKVSLRRRSRRLIRENFCSLQRLLERRLGEASQRSSGTSPDDALVEAHVTLGLAKSLVDSIRIAPTIFPLVARKRRPSRIEFILTDATRPQIDAPSVPAPPAMDEPTDRGDEEQGDTAPTESAEAPEPGSQAAVLAALNRMFDDEPDDGEEEAEV